MTNTGKLKNGLIWSNLKTYKKLILELTSLLPEHNKAIALENINDDIEENIHLLEVQISWLKGEQK